MYDNHQKLKQESSNLYLNDTSILIRDEAKYLAEQVLGCETFKEINSKISFLLIESNKKDIEIKNISNILNNKYDFFLNKLEEKVTFFLNNKFTEKNEVIDKFSKKDFDHLKIEKQNLDELSSKTFLKKLLMGFFEAKNIFFDILHSFFDINDLQQQDIRNELNNSVQEFRVFIDDVSIVVESLKTFEAKNYELIQKNEKDILNLFNKLNEKNEHKFIENTNLPPIKKLNDFQDSEKYLIELNKVWEEQAIFFNKIDKLIQDKDIISEKLNNLIEENNIKNNSVITEINTKNNSAEELSSFSDDLLNIIQNQNLISEKFEELHKSQEEQKIKNEKDILDLFNKLDENEANKFTNNTDLISDKELDDFQDSKKYLTELNKVWEEQAIFFNKIDKLTQDKDIISEKLNNLIEENNIKNNSIFIEPKATNDYAKKQDSFANDLLSVIQNQNLISEKFEELHKSQEELNKSQKEQESFTNDILSVIQNQNLISEKFEELHKSQEELNKSQKEQELKNENFNENIDLLSETILNYFNKEKSNDDSTTNDNWLTNINNVIENDKFVQFIDNKLFNSIEKYEVLNSSFYDKVIDNISLLKKAIEEEFVFQKKLFFSEIDKINLFLKNTDIDNLGVKIQNNSDSINKMGDVINSKNIDNIISSKMIEIVNSSISDVESKIVFLKKDIENILLNKNFDTNGKEVNNLENKIKNQSLSKIFNEINKAQSFENDSKKEETEEIKNDYKLLIENLRILNTIENLLKDQFLFQKNLTDEKKDSISKNINKINLLKENINEVKIQINKSSFSEILDSSETDLEKISKINEETYTLIQKSTMELVKNEINTYKLWENNSSYFDNKIKNLLEKLNCKNI